MTQALLLSYGGGNNDPFFASVSLLLHLNGTNGSTTFTDTSSSPKTVTASGNAQISTAQAQFGGASAIFDGTGDALTTPDNTAFAMGSGDFTFEAWVWRSNSMGAGGRIIFAKANGGEFTPYALTIDNTGTLNGFASNNGTAYQVSLNAAAGTIPAQTWTHVAYVREGNVFSLYAAGSRVATTTNAIGALVTNARAAAIGATSDATASHHGHIDEVRITKGVARYSGTTYTVPTAPFPDA